MWRLRYCEEVNAGSPPRPTLALVCGLPGAGKTTVARSLEGQRGMIRLCPDEWLATLGADIFDGPMRERVESIQRIQMEALLSLGLDVVIEWGFWGALERQGLCDYAREVGARVELHYLDAPLSTLVDRVEARDGDIPERRITKDEMSTWSDIFERPTPEELALYDLAPSSTAGQTCGDGSRHDTANPYVKVGTVHLICGLPASGKSTVARAIARDEEGLCLTLDSWMQTLYDLNFDDPSYGAHATHCQSLMWKLAVAVIHHGRSCVLDWNQWSKERRSRWRHLAQEVGAKAVVHWVTTPLEQAILQSDARNALMLAGAYRLSESDVRHMVDLFEPPDIAEGHVIRHPAPSVEA